LKINHKIKTPVTQKKDEVVWNHHNLGMRGGNCLEMPEDCSVKAAFKTTVGIAVYADFVQRCVWMTP